MSTWTTIVSPGGGSSDSIFEAGHTKGEEMEAYGGSTAANVGCASTAAHGGAMDVPHAAGGGGDVAVSPSVVPGRTARGRGGHAVDKGAHKSDAHAEADATKAPDVGLVSGGLAEELYVEADAADIRTALAENLEDSEADGGFSPFDFGEEEEEGEWCMLKPDAVHGPMGGAVDAVLVPEAKSVSEAKAVVRPRDEDDNDSDEDDDDSDKDTDGDDGAEPPAAKRGRHRASAFKPVGTHAKAKPASSEGGVRSPAAVKSNAKSIAKAQSNSKGAEAKAEDEGEGDGEAGVEGVGVSDKGGHGRYMPKLRDFMRDHPHLFKWLRDTRGQSYLLILDDDAWHSAMEHRAYRSKGKATDPSALLKRQKQADEAQRKQYRMLLCRLPCSTRGGKLAAWLKDRGLDVAIRAVEPDEKAAAKGKPRKGNNMALLWHSKGWFVPEHASGAGENDARIRDERARLPRATLPWTLPKQRAATAAAPAAAAASAMAGAVPAFAAPGTAR